MKRIPEMKAVAQRIVNAENAFIAICVEHHGFTIEQATKILQVYKRVKAIKINAVGGGFQFTHGAFYERDVMQNALAME
jgi:hypothetical protein